MRTLRIALGDLFDGDDDFHTFCAPFDGVAVALAMDWAVIWAMSSSCGGASLVAASASRNMVLQKGQAAPTMLAPVAAKLLRAHVADALAGFFAEKGQAAAGAAAEAALARTRRIDDFAGAGEHLARLVVDVAIAAQIAGIVVDDLGTIGFG